MKEVPKLQLSFNRMTLAEMKDDFSNDSDQVVWEKGSSSDDIDRDEDEDMDIDNEVNIVMSPGPKAKMAYASNEMRSREMQSAATGEHLQTIGFRFEDAELDKLN